EDGEELRQDRDAADLEHRIGHAALDAAVLQHVYAGAAEAELRPLGEQRHLARQAPWIGEVVGVHAGDQFAPGELQPFIQRGDEAAVFARDEPDAAVGLAVALEDLQRVVARAVVDRYHLQAIVVLAQDRADRGGDVGPGIVDRQKHGNERRGSHWRASFRWRS